MDLLFSPKPSTKAELHQGRCHSTLRILGPLPSPGLHGTWGEPRTSCARPFHWSVRGAIRTAKCHGSPRFLHGSLNPKPGIHDDPHGHRTLGSVPLDPDVLGTYYITPGSPRLCLKRSLGDPKRNFLYLGGA